MKTRTQFLAFVRSINARVLSMAAMLRRWSRLPIAIAFLLALVITLFIFREDLFTRATYGSIWVDSPEIYTRERLVNDRFLQDAWLSRQLDLLERADNAAFTSVLEASTALRIRGGTTQPQAAEPARQGAASSNTGSSPKISSALRDRLIEAVDFREQVRNLLIENQLDDRHDLNGNALYRLKYDATVIPGDKTRSYAEIRVRLQGPLAAASDAHEPKPDLESDPSAYRAVYIKWLDSLSTRLNQTHKELKQVFLSNEFSHNDYARLIAFLGINNDIDTRQLKGCPSYLTELRAQSEERLAELTPEEHIRHKLCVTAVLEASFDAEARKAKASGLPPASGTYVDSYKTNVLIASDVSSPPTTATLSAANNKAQVVAHQLDRWLNAFFANKAVQLVLGIVVPESVFARNIYVDIPALARLTELSFFNPEFSAQDGNVFKVRQKIFLVAAIDPDVISATKFRELSSNPMSPLSRLAYEDFKPEVIVSNRKLLLSASHLSPLEGEGVAIDSLKFLQDDKVKGVYRAVAEVGLLNFARRAVKNTRAFTYAVAPKETSDAALTTQSRDYDVSGLFQAPSPGDPEIQGSVQKRTAATSINRQGRLVGFGSANAAEGEAEFGWVIGPRRLVGAGNKGLYVHSPAQYSMSALVSIPSWWDTIKLQVTTSWIDEDGTRRLSKELRYAVDVPTDFEPLEATLLQVQQLGPELMESRLDPILLTACHPGAIVIPGRRLWRSSVVTMGYQTADEIAVLPNMKGIIAKFSAVQNQISQREISWAQQAKIWPPEIQRAVRVWTSQGTIALPTPARIGIPDDCPSSEPRK